MLSIYQKKQIMEENKRMVLTKKNYLFIIIGCVVVLLGLSLMAGGGSENAEVFSPEIFSFRKIALEKKYGIYIFFYEFAETCVHVETFIQRTNIVYFCSFLI